MQQKTKFLSIVLSVVVSLMLVAGFALGATTIGANITSAGDITINTDKFVVTGSSGNTSVGGTLGVTGNTTLTGTLAVNGATATFGNSVDDTVILNGRMSTSSVAGAALDLSDYDYPELWEIRATIDDWTAIDVVGDNFTGAYFRFASTADSANSGAGNLKGMEVNISSTNSTGALQGLYVETQYKTIAATETIGKLQGIESNLSLYTQTQTANLTTWGTPFYGTIGIAGGYQAADLLKLHGMIIETRDDRGGATASTLGYGLYLANKGEGVQTWTKGIYLNMAAVTGIHLAGAMTTGINISGAATTDISLQSGETIDNATNNVVKITSPALVQAYDAGDYWTATQANGGGVTFDSASDGTSGFTFSDKIVFGTVALDGDYFDVAATTGAVTLTQQAVAVVPLTVTGLDNATAVALDLNVHNVSGSIIDVDWTAETQTGAVAGLDIDLSNLTSDNTNNIYGVHVNDFTSGGAGGNLYGVYVEGTDWDYGLYNADATFLGADITLQNSETLGNGTDGTFLFSRNTDADVTLMGADSAGAANLIVDTTGAGAITIGSADVTAITLTTDGTGDGTDVVLPTGAIATGEILDDTVSASDLAATLSFVDGDYLDLSAAVTTTALAKGLKLPQKTDCSTGTTEGVICWDTDSDTLYIGDGAAAAAISPSVASANIWTNVNTWQDNLIGTFAGDEDFAITNASATTNDVLSLTVTNTDADAAQISLTLGNDANVDTTAGLNVAVTSANTGDADVLSGLNIADLTSADGTVIERAITVGGSWDANLFFNDTTTQIQIADGGTFTFENATGTDFLALVAGTATVTGDLSLTGGDITGANSDSIDVAETADATFTFVRDNSGTVTLMGADDAGAADTTYDTTGTGAIVVGSADVTSITLTTDGTGTGEVVLPASSVGASEIADVTRSVNISLGSLINVATALPLDASAADTYPDFAMTGNHLTIVWDDTGGTIDTTAVAGTVVVPADYVSGGSFIATVAQDAATGDNLESLDLEVTVQVSAGAPDTGLTANAATDLTSATTIQLVTFDRSTGLAVGNAIGFQLAQGNGSADDAVQLFGLEFQYTATE